MGVVRGLLGRGTVMFGLLLKDGGTDIFFSAFLRARGVAAWFALEAYDAAMVSVIWCMMVVAKCAAMLVLRFKRLSSFV